MEFNYTKVWDSETLTYEWVWKNGEDYITVENQSEVDVVCDITFNGKNGYANAVEFEFDLENAVDAVWYSSTLALAQCSQSAVESVEITPSGTIYVNIAEGVKIDFQNPQVTLGQITISVSIDKSTEEK